MKNLVFLAAVVLAGCSGCMNPVIREKVILGEERARRMVELIEAGTATLEELKLWAKADLQVWAALREAIE